ncbi:hypothetical protein D7V97_15620 [Corallococcus sp. CA053C]|uniref:hypothetical protein n=1 Tax=Corallococcus sp. CA053C TaxID=2316732 RepID=UPI000EA3EE2E|nr:hypothetical protein [Corallococcus sp. CA053C]RKH09739.1 hypothetical protein D7V97_15620 [Corallococcus sp. CA053C]
MSLLGHRFRHRFGLAQLLSTDARGEEEYSEPTTHACRYEGSVRRITAADGTDAITEAILYTGVEVKPGDAIWLPGTTPGDLNTQRHPLLVTPRFAIGGAIDHYEVAV